MTGAASANDVARIEGGSAFYVWLAAVVAATSGLLFGFDIAVINGAILFLREQLGLNELQTEFAASSLLFGCIFGASVAGWLSDRFGRRRVLMACAVLFALSAVAAALPRTLAEFVAARFIGGIAIGAASLLAPMYIAEVAPAAIRGRLVSLNQMAIVTGILLACLTGWLAAFLGPAGWRWMFAAAAVPSLALFLGLLFVPESPRWLVEQTRGDEALRVLTRINGSAAATAELESIRIAVDAESGTLGELLQPGLRRALWIAVSLAILQQITGINTVLFYGSVIFREQVGGQSGSSALLANVAVGVVNLLATIIALWVVDRLGRRPLLMISTAAMAVCHVALAVAFLMQPRPAWVILGAMLGSVTAFAVGLGPVFWVVLAEIFPTRIRGRAMSLATICLWSACTLLTMTFLSLTRAISATGSFLIYAMMCVVTFVIVLAAVPETRGLTLEQIERLWTQRERAR
jgi:SP family arabinose:H+ symporter-like MFS transporter